MIDIRNTGSPEELELLARALEQEAENKAREAKSLRDQIALFVENRKTTIEVVSDAWDQNNISDREVYHQRGWLSDQVNGEMELFTEIWAMKHPDEVDL